MKRTAQLSLALVLMTASLPMNAFGQTATTTKISGLVTDAQGAAVSGAAVRLVDQATNFERASTTNEEGRYVFPSLDPSTYTITVTAQGFRKATITDIKAEVAKSITVDIVLEAGGAEEQVTVTATEQVRLQKEDASIGNVIDSDRLKRLPNINRQATTLLALQPATMPSGEVSGARRDQNTFNLDGIDVSDNVIGLPFRTTIPVPTESVEEFRVTVANPNATFGRSGGGQINLVTKRGSNSFHGSLYEYHQNDALNANSWTNNRLGLPKPAVRDNRFGGTISGPIAKDRFFFFFNYEGRRLPGAAQTTRIVPTESFRRGILRFRDASGNVFSVDPRTFDPRRLGANPQILSFLNLMPLPNNFQFGDGLNTGGFTNNFKTFQKEDYGVLRLDYQINQNWSFEAKGSASRLLPIIANQVSIANCKGPGDSNCRATATFPERPKNLTFALTGTIRPNLVNELRIGHVYDSRILNVIPPAPIGGFNTAVDLAPVAQAANPALQLLDEPIDVDTQRARRQSILSGTTQFVDNATWINGAHAFQFGGTLRRITTIHFRDDKVIGSLVFPVAQIGAAGNVTIPPSQRPPTCDPARGITSNCLQATDLSRYNQFYATLLGIVDNVGYLAIRDSRGQPIPIGTPLVNDAVLRHWEFYFADTWKIKPSLTFSYGLMYQWHTPPSEKEGRQTLAIFKDTRAPVEPKEYLRLKREAAERGDIFNPDLSYTTLRDLGRKGVFDINREDFSPRVSIAWNPSLKVGLLGALFGARRTVFRGGYSLLYDRANTVATVVIPMLGVGFAQTLTLRAPQSGGNPLRAAIDGNIPVPANFPVSFPLTPAKPFGELLSFLVDPTLDDPKNHSIDLTIQRELPGRMILELGYVARLGRDLYQSVNLNSIAYFHKDKQSGQTFAEAFDGVARELRGGVAPSSVTPQAWFENQLGAGRTRLLASLLASDFVVGNVSNIFHFLIDLLAPRPYNNLQVLDLFYRAAIGRSNYHAFIATLRKRPSHGLSFEFNYTLSKSLDQVGEWQNSAGELPTSFFPDVDYGPSFFDRRHVASASFVYDLPFRHKNRALDKIVGGWYVSGIFTANSGLPLSVIQGFQVYGGSAIFGFATGAIPLRKPNFGNQVHKGVNGSGGIGVNGDPARGGSGLNMFTSPEEVAKSFRQIELSRDGRSGRGVLRGFPSWNLDLSLGKQAKIGEAVKFGLSLDFFNIFNHVVFADPSLNLNDLPNFGVIRAQANSPRVIQIGARFEF